MVGERNVVCNMCSHDFGQVNVRFRLISLVRAGWPELFLMYLITFLTHFGILNEDRPFGFELTLVPFALKVIEIRYRVLSCCNPKRTLAILLLKRIIVCWFAFVECVHVSLLPMIFLSGVCATSWLRFNNKINGIKVVFTRFIYIASLVFHEWLLFVLIKSNEYFLVN